jgi:hypothetical protein
MHRFLAVSRLAAVAAFIACASAGGTSGARGRSDFITQADIATSGTSNAWDLINRLRPNWLKAQPIGSIGGGAHTQVVAVYLDGQRFGDITSLRTLSTTGIRSAQWLDSARAATVMPDPGSDPIAGAIVIKTH